MVMAQLDEPAFGPWPGRSGAGARCRYEASNRGLTPRSPAGTPRRPNGGRRRTQARCVRRWRQLSS